MIMLLFQVCYEVYKYLEQYFLNSQMSMKSHT
jgi:hypothetical protein